MESGSVRTPFERRPMALGTWASQLVFRDIEDDKSIDKWKLNRALCEARPLMDVTDHALAVMSKLLSLYPEDELAETSGSNQNDDGAR